MTALPMPDGRTLLASGGDTGKIALWNPVTGQPVREPSGDWPGGVTGMCAATVPDGRTLLVTATPTGAVRLWDPDTGECVGRLNPYGSPIQSIAAVPISASHMLIAASDTAGRLHVWDPAVDDPWESGAAVQLNARALADADHRVAAVAAVPTHDRTVLATGDNRGVVMLWDLATGAPIGDGLPASTGTAGLPVLTATTLHGGRTVLVTGTRARSPTTDMGTGDRRGGAHRPGCGAHLSGHRGPGRDRRTRPRGPPPRAHQAVKAFGRDNPSHPVSLRRAEQRDVCREPARRAYPHEPHGPRKTDSAGGTSEFVACGVQWGRWPSCWLGRHRHRRSRLTV